MSLLPQVNAYHTDGKGQYDYFFALANESAKQWSLYPAISTVQMNGNPLDFTPSTQVTTNGDNLLINGVPMTNSTILGSTIANWSLYPAISSVNFNNNEILSTTRIELDGVYITATYDEILINGDPVITSTAFATMSSITEWAYYEALSTVNMAGNYIDNCSKIVLDGAEVTTAGNYILVNAFNPVENWAKFAASSNVNINSKNINNANQLNFITATPGPLTTGATINSLNSLNFSYATALVRQANITNLNNIAFWNPSYPGVPAFAANMYTVILTYNGDAGTTYIGTDTNLSVPRLFLGGLAGTAGGKVEVIGDDAVYVTVNNTPCPQSWSRFRATQAVDFNANQATRCSGVDFTLTGDAPFNLLTINAGGFLTAAGNLIVTSPASADINVNNFGLTAVRDIKFNGAGKLLATNTGGALTYDGQVITTGEFGDARNWAKYKANSNVVIPKQYSLSINGENGLTIYQDSHLNTNIYHGVEGNASSPDFISFPTTFQVGTTVNPAREITMTAGALGFGINSDTEVNIDATALVNIYSEGVVSIESITDFNLTASLTTFLIGEWNTTALATTFEVASFDVISAGNVSILGTVATIVFGATTVTTAGLGITAGAVVAGVASWNLVSAGNVTTVGTQVGITAGTKFETLSASDTNLIANGVMNISSLIAINLGAPVVNIQNANISSLNVKSAHISTLTAYDIDTYNISTVNLYLDAMFSRPTGGQINIFDDVAMSRTLAVERSMFAPKVSASTIYGVSGGTPGALFLESASITATGNLRVLNTLYGDDARFTGQTTLSSIQAFVAQPVTFANNQTNMPNNVTISTLTVQTVNGAPYPPAPLLNPSGFATASVVQALTTTPTQYDTLSLTFIATSTGWTMVTGLVTVVSNNGANWTASAEIVVDGVPSGNINTFTNTGNGHQTQIMTMWRFPSVNGTTYTLSLTVYGSATVDGSAEQGNLSFISGLT